MPCAFIIVFSSLGRRFPLELFTPSSLASSLAVFGFTMLIMLVATLLAKDRSSGLFARLRATPLRPGDFLLAYSLPYLPFALVQVLACYATGLALGANLGWGLAASLLALLPAAACCVGLGLILGSFLAENQIAGVGSGLVTAIAMLSDAWFDLRMAGGLFEKIGYALPFARATDASRALFGGASLAAVGSDLAWVWAWAIVLLGGGLLSLRIKVKP
jgi:ABC-2 type transport system permease protein